MMAWKTKGTGWGLHGECVYSRRAIEYRDPGQKPHCPALQFVTESLSYCFRFSLLPQMLDAVSTLIKAHIVGFHATQSLWAFPYLVATQESQLCSEDSSSVSALHPGLLLLFCPLTPFTWLWTWCVALWLPSHFPAQFRLWFNIGRRALQSLVPDGFSPLGAAPLCITLSSTTSPSVIPLCLYISWFCCWVCPSPFYWPCLKKRNPNYCPANLKGLL